MDRPEPDLSWRPLGACVGQDPNLFYPGRGEANREAAAICAECPVSGPCLEWALRHEHFGTWGGVSERERRRLRKKRGIRVDSPQVAVQGAQCGTTAGSQLHYRLGQPLCDACRAARNAYQAHRKRLARAAAS